MTDHTNDRSIEDDIWHLVKHEDYLNDAGRRLAGLHPELRSDDAAASAALKIAANAITELGYGPAGVAWFKSGFFNGTALLLTCKFDVEGAAAVLAKPGDGRTAEERSDAHRVQHARETFLRDNP